jgi:hypothetical protein
LQETLPDLNNKSNVLDIPESKSTVFGKDFKAPGNPFKDRRILKKINYEDEIYKDKYEDLNNLENSRETFFRRTNFIIRDDKSKSSGKRTPSASNRLSSKNSNFSLILRTLINAKQTSSRVNPRKAASFTWSSAALILVW